MKLLTCTGCAIDRACTVQTDMRDKLKGLGIRSLKFACKHRVDLFQPGQPVLFTTFTTSDCESDYDGLAGRLTVVYPGHVIKQMGGKVFGFIKPETPDTSEGYPFEAKAGGYVKIPLSRVKTDNSRPVANAAACDWCNRHIGLGAICEKDPHYTPSSQCLADKFASDPKASPHV